LLLGLGCHNVEDAVLKACGHRFLVDRSREVEATGKLADAALIEPVLGLVDGLLGLGLFLLSSLSAGLVWDGLVYFLTGLLAPLASLSNSTARGSALDEACRGGTGSIGALSLAADEHSLGLGELDVDILLVDTRELAMEFIRFPGLADVELGLPARHTSATAAHSLTRVAVEVVKEAEEGSERGVGVIQASREESHCACLVEGRLEC